MIRPVSQIDNLLPSSRQGKAVVGIVVGLAALTTALTTLEAYLPVTRAAAQEARAAQQLQIDGLRSDQQQDRAQVKEMKGQLDTIESIQNRALVLQLRQEYRALTAAISRAQPEDRDVLVNQQDDARDTLKQLGALP